MPRINLTKPLGARVGSITLELGSLYVDWRSGEVKIGLDDENDVRHLHVFSAQESANVLNFVKRGKPQGNTKLRKWILQRAQVDLEKIAGTIDGEPE